MSGAGDDFFISSDNKYFIVNMIFAITPEDVYRSCHLYIFTWTTIYVYLSDPIRVIKLHLGMCRMTGTTCLLVRIPHGFWLVNMRFWTPPVRVTLRGRWKQNFFILWKLCLISVLRHSESFSPFSFFYYMPKVLPYSWTLSTLVFKFLITNLFSKIKHWLRG